MARSIFPDGDAIRKHREMRCLTQEELARRADLDVKTIRNAERGIGIAVSSLVQISNALELPPSSLIGAANESVSDDARVKEIVLQWMRSWDERDMDTMMSLYADVAVTKLPGGPGIPFGGEHRGIDAIRQANQMAWDTCETTPNAEYSLDVLGNQVILKGLKGMHLPNGEVARLWSWHIFTIDNGLIVELQVQYDTLEFARLMKIPRSTN